MKYIKLLQSIMLMLAVMITANASATEYVTYYFNDAQGTPIAATNETGNVIWKKEHAPYGKVYGNTDDKANRIGYTGHVEEEHFNLVYMQQRWYDPTIGRFYSVDPIGFSENDPMTFNRYAYANNNPYKFVDPDGRAGVVPTFSLTGGVTAMGQVNAAGGEATRVPLAIAQLATTATLSYAVASAAPVVVAETAAIVKPVIAACGIICGAYADGVMTGLADSLPEKAAETVVDGIEAIQKSIESGGDAIEAATKIDEAATAGQTEASQVGAPTLVQ